MVNKYKFSIDYKLSGGSKDAENENNNDYNTFLLELIKNYKINLLEMKNIETEDTIFTYAIKNKDLENVKILVNYNEGIINSKDSLGKTPLHIAAEIKNNSEIINYLIEKNAEVDALDIYQQTPLYYTLENIENVIVLKNNNANFNIRANDNHTLLHKAVYVGNNDVIDFIFDEITDIDVQDGKGWTPLHIAAEKGNTYIVEKLIEKNANVNIQNENGDTPLHIAVSNNKIDVVKYLVKNKNIQINKQNYDGDTPLHFASYNNNREIIIDLINNGANMDILNLEDPPIKAFPDDQRYITYQ